MARRDRERRPARRTAFLQPRKRLLVVCEGELTEPSYLEGFRDWVRNPLVSIRIAEEHGDPLHCVRSAKRLRDEARQDAKSQRDDNLEFDEVWAVFDRDDHERLTERIREQP
jgi:hypothetical protein